MIKVEYRKTYKALNGKSYFTLDAAIRRSVYKRLFDKNEMGGYRDWIEGGECMQEEFYSDEQMDCFAKVTRRYLKMFKKSIRKAIETKEHPKG